MQSNCTAANLTGVEWKELNRRAALDRGEAGTVSKNLPCFVSTACNHTKNGSDLRLSTCYFNDIDRLKCSLDRYI